MERVLGAGGITLQVCLTCPARIWDSPERRYICNPLVFTADKYHPNGGSRLKPAECPIENEMRSDNATEILRQTLKK